MQSINLPSLGKLIQDSKFDDWWISDKKINVPLFDHLGIKLTLIAKENEINEDFNKAISHFLQLDSRQRLEANKYVFNNYKEFVETVGEDEFDFKVTNEENIWKHVHPTDIYVTKRLKDDSVYIQIAAECDWEEEHGLQIIYKDGNKLSRVSAQDGHLTYCDAYALPESEDRIC